MATAPRTKITQDNLQFFPSERLTDNPDGGGMPLGTPITGESNELFNPIASIVRVNGGFFTRLVYAGVQRDDAEPLIGSFMALTTMPTDVNVSYVLVAGTNFGEMRAETIKRIEAFNVATIESRMTLLSTQSANSRLVQAYQRVGEPLPLIGDVYCLSQKKVGFAQIEQYIQVTKVTSEDRNFTTPQNEEITRTALKIEISQKLKHDFVGVDYPSKSYADSPCKIRETATADAAQYYGIKPITEPITQGEFAIQLPDLMEKIVPTTQIQTKLLDLTAAGTRQTLFNGTRDGVDGIVTLSINSNHAAGTISTIYLGNAATPNSINMTLAFGAITDKGGKITLNGNNIGTIDYARGLITISEINFSGYLTSVKFRPAASEMHVADTSTTAVSVNNRGESWSVNIDPPPAPGSLIGSFMAQGRWYDLIDDGSGVLRGASAAHGSGTINYATGTANIDAGELPDIGSNIMWSWSNTARYFNRAGGVASAKMVLNTSGAYGVANRNDVYLKWNDGADKTADIDSTGAITGDWTGYFDLQNKQIRIDTGANFNHPVGVLDVQMYSKRTTQATMQFKSFGYPEPTVSTGATDLVLSSEPLEPNTVRLSYDLLIEQTEQVPNPDLINKKLSATDDGLGVLKDEKGKTVGTVDYAAGTASLTPDTVLSVPSPKFRYNGYRFVFTGHEYQTVNLSDTIVLIVEVEFALASDTSAAGDVLLETLSTSNIEIDLLPNFAEVIAPSSLNVAWGGNRYFDRLGAIYTNLNVATGAADLAGTIDYSSGKMQLTRWDWTDGAAPNIVSLATSIDGNPVDAVSFRTPTAPIRAGSLSIRATAIDGTRISETVSLAGTFDSANMQGVTDFQTGVSTLRFGQFVTAAGNESEPWYDVELINSDGKIWRSKHVFAETITYNANALSYLPVDSSIVKIDTVRLPQDGRVPIFRRGDTIIIGNRKKETIGSAHTAGQTITLNRGDLDRICISDADDVPVDAQMWDYDLDVGSITWATPLDLAAYKMPLHVSHAQEQRNRIRETDISGKLELIFQTNRDYPIADTYVSSVLIGGDLQVRVSAPFTQRTWNNIWQDTPIGSQLLNKLNLTDHPMVLKDRGAITERWMIKMTGTSTLELYGERLGFVMRGDTLQDLQPINPATGTPYFVIPKQAFGTEAPWAPQDIIRYNTWGTLLPVSIICAVQPSDDVPQGVDGFTQCLYGDTTEITV